MWRTHILPRQDSPTNAPNNGRLHYEEYGEPSQHGYGWPELAGRNRAAGSRTVRREKLMKRALKQKLPPQEIFNNHGSCQRLHNAIGASKEQGRRGVTTKQQRKIRLKGTQSQVRQVQHSGSQHSRVDGAHVACQSDGRIPNCSVVERIRTWHPLSTMIVLPPGAPVPAATLRSFRSFEPGSPTAAGRKLNIQFVAG